MDMLVILYQFTVYEPTYFDGSRSAGSYCYLRLLREIFGKGSENAGSDVIIEVATLACSRVGLFIVETTRLPLRLFSMWGFSFNNLH